MVFTLIAFLLKWCKTRCRDQSDAVLLLLRLGALAVLLEKCLSVHSHNADDIVLITPTSRTVRCMLFTYDSFADNFSTVFNVKKNQSV